MASPTVSSTPKLYSFLGDDLAASFVRRVFAAQGLDMEISAEYYDALLANTSEKLDVFVLEHLSAAAIQKLYLLMGTEAPQNLITNYLKEQIPNLNAELVTFFDQLLVSVSKKIN